MNEQLVANALQRTDPKLYYEVGGRSTFQEALRKRGARVFKYRKYERGDHDANLTKQQRKLLNILEDDAELNEASANYCSIVVDMMAGRLSVAEIAAEDESTAAWVNDTLQRNSFESFQGQLFRGAIRDSESFALVDPQTAIWTNEPAYDGYSGVVAIYDAITRLPKWACKLWSESEPADLSSDADDTGDDQDVVYLVVYQRDRITYWRARTDGGEVDPAPIEDTGGTLTVTEDGNGYEWPVGLIPIEQFANKRDNYSPYGESEIRSVIPLQDITNATLYDMMMASKLSAFKIYWSIGMEVDKDGIVPGSVVNLVLKDNDGNVVTEIDEALARYLAIVKVGEFGTTDMSQYTNQLDKLEREISQVSATPIYGITAQGNLSGEALKQLEIGLVNKIMRFQRENTGAIIRLLKMTARIQHAFKVDQSFGQKFTANIADFLGLQAPNKPKGNLGDLSVNWDSPEIVNVSDQLNALSQMRRDNPGLWADEWYRERVGALLGMSSTQITEEGDKAMQSQMAAFDRIIGGGATGAPPTV